jgi:poly(3-hydroxybutyrate) depolymerase
MSRRLMSFFLAIALTACSPKSSAPQPAETSTPSSVNQNSIATGTASLEMQAAPSLSKVYEENRHLFDYDTDSPVSITENAVQQEEGFTVHDISYPSPKGGEVPAYLVIPDGTDVYAAILLMHGSSGSRESLLPMAKDLVHTGAVVMTISGPAARTPNRDWIHFAPQDREEQIQLIIDLRRGVDVFLQHANVDPERIAYIGYSYGAAMGGLLAGVEHRIRAYGLMVGDGGLVTHFTEDGKPVEGLDTIPAALREAWLQAMEPIDSIHYVGHAAPSALFFQNARFDSLVTEADALAYQAAGSEPKRIEWYDSGHGLPAQAYVDMAGWLAQVIGIDASNYPGTSR